MPFSTAHVWRAPQLSPVTLFDRLRDTALSTGTSVDEVSAPNCRNSLDPQHNTSRLSVLTHVCESPAQICVISSGPFNSKGLTADTPVELPDWPWSFAPQQTTSRPPRTTHVCSLPLATRFTSGAAETTIVCSTVSE